MSDRPFLNPVLKWPGGKRWLVHKLFPYYDHKRRLVDPFVGGLSIPLGLAPDRALISDINPHLINLYRWLQAGLVWDPSCGIEFSYTSKVYYENREKFNLLCEQGNYTSKEGALLLYYLNKSGFNGLFRFNKAGQYNVAFGTHKKVEYKLDFTEYKEAMKDWEINCGDFQTLVLQPDDFIYADPPYDQTFTRFSKEEFGWADQERLAHWLARHPGPVIASNSSTDRIIDLYRGLGFNIYTGKAPRRISCDGDRSSAIEVLAFKNL